MPVQAVAIEDREHRHVRKIGLSATQAQRARRVRDALRCVIDRVGVANAGQGRVEDPAPDRLVIDARRGAGGRRHRREAVAVVVGVIDGAARRREPLELAHEGPAGRVIGEEDRVAEDSRCAGRDQGLLRPDGLRRRMAVVENDLGHVRQEPAEVERRAAVRDRAGAVAEGLLGVPVDPDRGLAGIVAERRGIVEEPGRAGDGDRDLLWSGLEPRARRQRRRRLEGGHGDTGCEYDDPPRANLFWVPRVLWHDASSSDRPPARPKIPRTVPNARPPLTRWLSMGDGA